MMPSVNMIIEWFLRQVLDPIQGSPTHDTIGEIQEVLSPNSFHMKLVEMMGRIYMDQMGEFPAQSTGRGLKYMHNGYVPL